MISLVRGGGRLLRAALAAGLAAWVGSALPGKAEAGDALCPTCHKTHSGPHGHVGSGGGTLGYGKPGLYPGFQGFGLGYHLGYGYGGHGLGVGADGGFPFYSGPGYPHPWPRLRRFGGIAPFPFFGGPGGPTPTCPNYFGPVGPLVSERPVIEIEPEPGEADYTSGYGGFTGVLPYPEAVLAPFTAAAAAGRLSNEITPTRPTSPAPASGDTSDDQGGGSPLGFNVEPVTDPAGGRGLKVVGIAAESAVQKAGLRDGDVITSINGYATVVPAHLTWIRTNAAPDRNLRMTVRAGDDGQVRTVMVQSPTTSR